MRAKGGLRGVLCNGGVLRPIFTIPLLTGCDLCASIVAKLI